MYAGQEATIRIGHRTMDWFKIRKGVCQGCLLSPCLFSFYAEYIKQNAGLDEAQAGIQIPRININSLRYADNTTLMAESKEELKSLLMKVKEESEKAGLKFNIKQTKNKKKRQMASFKWHPVPSLHGKYMGKKWKTVAEFIFLGSKITEDGDCSHEIKRHLHLGRKPMTDLNSIVKSRDLTLLTKVWFF